MELAVKKEINGEAWNDGTKKNAQHTGGQPARSRTPFRKTRGRREGKATTSRNEIFVQVCDQLLGEAFVEALDCAPRAKKEGLIGIGSSVVFRSSPTIARSISWSRFLQRITSLDAPSPS